MAKGGERLCRMAAPFLEGAACGGRRTCSPFDLACEECPRARGVPPREAGERAGEDKGVALEPRRREAGLWRPPQELGRLLAAGLGSTVLRSGALLTDFLGASARVRGRAFEAARGSPTSAPPLRDRWEMAGKGAPGVGPEESRDKAEGKGVIDTYRLVPLTAQEPHSSPDHEPLRVSTLRALILGVSGVFPLPLGSSAGSWSPFCPRGPSLRVGRACSGQSPPPHPTLPLSFLTSKVHIFFFICEMGHMDPLQP